MKKLSKIIALGALSTLMFFAPKIVKADEVTETASYSSAVSFQDFGTPSLSYTGFYADGTIRSGEQGTWVVGNMNSNGTIDNRWLNGVCMYSGGTGYYAYMKDVGVKAHLHNFGWTDSYPGTSGVAGTNFSKYGWIEALQLKTTGTLSDFAYIRYSAICQPLTWSYLVWKSGGEEYTAAVEKYGDFNAAETNLLANVPNAYNSWALGVNVYHENERNRTFYSNSAGSVSPYVSTTDNSTFLFGTNGNWAGTEGYSLPMVGFEADIQEYPCNVFVNPNGGNWCGATSSVQVGDDGLGTTRVHAGDMLTFNNDPTRTGYQFAGWSLNWAPTIASASTFYQQPTYNHTPQIFYMRALNVGNASSVTLTANWEKIKEYNVHFDGNGATNGYTSDQLMAYDVPANLNKNGFDRSFHVGYDGNGGVAEKGEDTAVSDFRGWLVNPSAVDISYTDQQYVKNIAPPGSVLNLYAGWHDNAVTLPNASKPDEYWEVDEDHKGWVKYYFTGWYTAPDGGVCVGRGGDLFTPTSAINLYAHWTYNVCIYYDGNTNDGGGMEMTDPWKGDEKTNGVDYIIRENTYAKSGCDFAGWNTIQVDGNGNVISEGLPRFAPGTIYNEDIPLTLFTAWKNKFDIAYMGNYQTEGKDYFDNNGGNDYSQLDGTVKLAKVDGMKQDLTKSFTDTFTGEEVVEDITAIGVGWGFAKDLKAQYKEAYIADDTEYSTAEYYAIAKQANGLTLGIASEDYRGDPYTLTSSNIMVANMYRVWDYGPLIEAYDKYFTLEQAQSGAITEDALLDGAIVNDDEDGEILAGANESNSFRVMDYQASEFTSLSGKADISVTYEAIDSASNSTKLKIMVHIADTEPVMLKSDGYTRFIDNKYSDKSENEGGLREKSLWKTDGAYQSALSQTFCNVQDHTPKNTYLFSHEKILKMQQYIEKNGVGNSQRDTALQDFYNLFIL